MIIVRHHPSELRIGDKVEKCIIEGGRSRWEVVGYVSRQYEGTMELFTYKSNETGQECFGYLNSYSPFFVTREY